MGFRRAVLATSPAASRVMSLIVNTPVTTTTARNVINRVRYRFIETPSRPARLVSLDIGECSGQGVEEIPGDGSMPRLFFALHFSFRFSTREPHREFTTFKGYRLTNLGHHVALQVSDLDCSRNSAVHGNVRRPNHKIIGPRFILDPMNCTMGRRGSGSLQL